MIRLALAALLFGALASPASAHALLRKAVPSVGATLASAPAAVTLRFSEGVEPAFSTIVVRDAAGARVDRGDVATVPNDPKTISVPLKPLAPGVYTVEWHATSVDTHKTEGRFTFTVAP
jgi:methionine-rich copper-binding protein CopC